MNYSEKLRDPRWQKKRLEIFERDSWACRYCGDKENTLAIHHTYYSNDLSPWEYPDDSLITVCERCHDYLSYVREFKEGWIEWFRRHIEGAEIFYYMPPEGDGSSVWNVFKWLLDDPYRLKTVYEEMIKSKGNE